MKRTLWLVLLFAAIAAVLWGTLFHFPFIYAYVIDPIVRIFWFAAKLFLMIDQEVYWVLLIFLSAGFLLWILPRDQDEPELTGPYRNFGETTAGLERWQGLFREAAEDADASDKLKVELQVLEHSLRELTAGERGNPDDGSEGWEKLEAADTAGGIVHRLPGTKWMGRKRFLREAQNTVAKMEAMLEMKNGKTQHK